MKLFVATKAFVKFDNKILILRESSKYDDGVNAGCFDVPGGRVEPGQRFDKSLLREINEETGLDVEMGNPFFSDEWRPIVNGEEWQIVGTYFICIANNSKVILSDDHDEFAWIDPREWEKYNLIPNLSSAFKTYLKIYDS